MRCRDIDGRLALVSLVAAYEFTEVTDEGSQVDAAGEHESRSQLELPIQFLNRKQSLDLFVVQKAELCGQLAKQFSVSRVFLDIEDLIDLLDREEVHPQREHADRVSGISPFTGLWYGMIIELQPMPQIIEERVSACRQHQHSLHLASRTVFHNPRDSFVTVGGMMLCRPDGP